MPTEMNINQFANTYGYGHGTVTYHVKKLGFGQRDGGQIMLSPDEMDQLLAILNRARVGRGKRASKSAAGWTALHNEVGLPDSVLARHCHEILSGKLTSLILRLYGSESNENRLHYVGFLLCAPGVEHRGPYRGIKLDSRKKGLWFNPANNSFFVENASLLPECTERDPIKQIGVIQ